MAFSKEASENSLNRIKRLLMASGATEEEITNAVKEDRLELLIIDKMFLGSRHYMTEDDVSKITGVNKEITKRFWRALGFPEVKEGELAFTDLDVEAVTTIESIIRLGLSDIERAVQLTRVIGSSIARIAESQVTMAQFVQLEDDPVLRAETLAIAAQIVIPSLVRVLEYAYRRHLQAAARRAWLYARSEMQERETSENASLKLAVGFADMVGFTWLSQQVSPTELANIVSRFESLAYDIIVNREGRIVKMIGDEVMFVVDHPELAVVIATELSSAYEKDDLLSDVRIGLAFGEVLPWEGDYFGYTVNKASRIVNIADPGSVLIDESVYEFVKDDERFTFRFLRPTYLKDIGRIQLIRVFKKGEEEREQRRGNFARWRVFADVIRDFEELKEQGQKLFNLVIQPQRDDGEGTDSH